MADIRLGQTLFFDRGIDTITAEPRDASRTLPEMRKLLPPETKLAHLERLLNQPTLASYIEQSIAPQIRDRTLLMPHVFRATLQATLKELRKEIERNKDPRSRRGRVLSRARRVLDEEEELRELAQMYASTLYQG